MSLFTSAEDLEGELLPALRAFLATPAGAEATVAVAGLDAGSVLVLQISDPETAVWIDFASGEVGTGDHDGAASQLSIDADSLHQLGMNRLAPVQVARAIEERRVDATGSFELMLLLLRSLPPLGEVWRDTLTAHGRGDLLDAPAPADTEVFAIDAKSKRQGYVPPWSRFAKRAASNSTRRPEEWAAQQGG
jgi:hypothetical protein